MNPSENTLQLLDQNLPEMWFDPTSDEFGFMTPCKVRSRHRVIQTVSLRMILKYSLIGAVSGLIGGNISVLLGASPTAIKYITTSGCLLGSVIGYFSKVEKKISVPPFF